MSAPCSYCPFCPAPPSAMVSKTEPALKTSTWQTMPGRVQNKKLQVSGHRQKKIVSTQALLSRKFFACTEFFFHIYNLYQESQENFTAYLETFLPSVKLSVNQKYFKVFLKTFRTVKILS